MKINTLIILIGSVFLTVWGGCIENNEPTFSIEQFRDNVVDAFDDNSLGWSYCINQDGERAFIGARGWARHESSEQIEMTASTRVYIASISKFITAVTALKIIQEEDDIDIDDPIGPYLPQSWNPTSAFAAITFRELLGHRSGLDGGNGPSGQTFQSLRTLAETASIGPKTEQYENVNFSLFRILIPNMLPFVVPTFNLTEEEAYAEVFAEYTREEIFRPVGITGVSLLSEANDALLYETSNINQLGRDPEDSHLIAGTTGWRMTANQLGLFMAAVWHTDILLNDQSRAFFNLTQFSPGGLSGGGANDNPSIALGLSESLHGSHGFYQAKGGSRFGQIHCFIMNYPNDVQVVVLRNTEQEGDRMRQELRDAFDFAWD